MSRNSAFSLVGNSIAYNNSTFSYPACVKFVCKSASRAAVLCFKFAERKKIITLAVCAYVHISCSGYIIVELVLDNSFPSSVKVVKRVCVNTCAVRGSTHAFRNICKKLVLSVQPFVHRSGSVCARTVGGHKKFAVPAGKFCFFTFRKLI